MWLLFVRCWGWTGALGVPFQGLRYEGGFDSVYVGLQFDCVYYRCRFVGMDECACDWCIGYK